MDELAREYHDTHDPENPRRDLQISQVTWERWSIEGSGFGLGRPVIGTRKLTRCEWISKKESAGSMLCRLIRAHSIWVSEPFVYSSMVSFNV
jgi:hypothetical protein